MIAAFESLRNEFRTFSMDGISVVLVCAAILFCIVEREHLGENVRKLAGYGMLFFILIANPFGYNIIRSFWMQDYWKIFMILLPTVFVSFLIVEVVSRQKNAFQGVLAAVCCVGVVAGSYFLNFDIEQIPMIGEMHQVDDEMAALDEVIRDAGIAPVNMIAPREVCAHIREYDAGVNLLYGERLMEEIIDKTAVSEDEEERQFIEECAAIIAVPEAVEHQIAMADKYESNCILIKNTYDDMKRMESAGFKCYGRTENYVVYFKI